MKQAKITDQPLSAFGELPQSVYVHCDPRLCGHGSSVALDDLRAQLGPQATTHDILRRFRCKKCGRSPTGFVVSHVVGV